MKKALLLFEEKSVLQGAADPAALVRLLNDTGKISALSAMLGNLLFVFTDKHFDVIDTDNHRSLTQYDVIYFRYWGENQAPALAAARFCKSQGIPFVDSEVLRAGSLNKITQYMNLHEAAVPFPATLIGKGNALMKEYAGYDFVFPLILKSVSGTRGKDNFLVRDEAEMRKVFADHPDVVFVLQEFIPNEGDYRVIVMGERVAGVIKRTATRGSHLNNTSQGGHAEWLPVDVLPEPILEQCVHAAAFFGRQIAGVDMVQNTANGRWYCFEVNRAPQIEHASFEREKALVISEYLDDLAT